MQEMTIDEPPTPMPMLASRAPKKADGKTKSKSEDDGQTSFASIAGRTRLNGAGQRPASHRSGPGPCLYSSYPRCRAATPVMA